MTGIPAITSAVVTLVSVVGCAEDAPDEVPTESAAVSLALDDLRTATSCPVGIDGSTLPESLDLGDAADVSVVEYGAAVQVVCQFPVVGAAPAQEVQVMLVVAPSDTDVFSVESASGGTWANVIYNETGVDPARLEQSVSELAGEEAEILEGNGESLAVRSIEVADAGSGLLLVYGDDTRTGDELAAVASALG